MELLLFHYRRDKDTNRWVNLAQRQFKGLSAWSDLCTPRVNLKSLALLMEDYVDLNHAEAVPQYDLQKPPNKVFYLPICMLLERIAALQPS